MNHRTPAFVLAVFVVLIVASPCFLRAQDWVTESRNFYFQDRFDDRFVGLNDNERSVVFDAPKGYVVLDGADASAKVLQQIPGPATVLADRYIEKGAVRFYLPTGEWARVYGKPIPPRWIFIPETGRQAFVEGTRSAQMLKKEKRNDLKLGPVNAEVYAETVPLFEETVWQADFRRAEVDFALPAKVEEFRDGADGSWEVRFTVFPAFSSDTDRIPGPAPEFYDDPYRALISTPNRREVTLRGALRGNEYRLLLVPGTVWAAGFSEGRLQNLRIGYSWLPPEVECSPLSNPIFKQGDRLAFQFSASLLGGGVTRIGLTPDQILGADYTDYNNLARLRPYDEHNQDELVGEREVFPDEWNLFLSSRLAITVVAPLMEGRGAAGMLELESLGLGDNYEEDLKALRSFWTVPPPEITAEDAGSWIRFLDKPLGEIPVSQRARP